MTSGFEVVDTDAHYSEDLAEIARYMDDPWKRRLVEGGPAARRRFFGGSTGSRNVWGRIQREHASYPHDNMDVGEIAAGMSFLGADSTIQISQHMLAMARLTADDDRALAFATGYVRFMLEEALDPSNGIYTALPIPYTKPDAAVELIDEMADEPGIVAGCMITAGADPPLGNDKYNPIYEAAEDNDLPLIFHTSGSGLDSFERKGYSTFLETHTLGFLQGNMSQLTSIVCRGIPEKFPDLEIAFQESGVFWVPLMMHRLNEEYLKRPSEAPILTKRPSEYMQEFYYGTQPLERSTNEDYLEYTIEMIGGPERLIYASDYPHWDFDRPSAIADLGFLTDAEKQQILAGNAKRVFGI